MDETYPIKAIILKREPYRESDTRVVVYGREHGRLDLVARGTKKLKSKMAGHLEPISVSNIMVVRGRQFDYAGSAVSERSFLNIKSDLEKIESAGKAFNFFLGIVKEGIEDAVLFDMLEGYLAVLDRSDAKAGSLSGFFILKLMARLGYKPELQSCVSCRQKIKPKGNRFDFSKGGLVCPECAKERGGSAETAVSDNVIKVMRMALTADFDALMKLKIDSKLSVELEKIISSFAKFLS